MSGESSTAGKKDGDGDEALARALQNLELRKGEVDNVTINEKDLIVMQKQV
jgi:hypothetical protein